jgi:phosphatidylserine decarboxylase
VNGALFTVNPIAIRQDINVYTENKRVVSEIHTPSFGTVVLVAVGATIVGSIHHLTEPGSNVTKGDQHGYFAFGGSTILVLFQVVS